MKNNLIKDVHLKIFLHLSVLLMTCSVAVLLSNKFIVLGIVGWVLAYAIIVVMTLIGIKKIEEKKLIIANLQESEKQARESSQAKTKFLAMASHELLTPLNGIVGLSELLLKSKLPNEANRFIENIYLSGKDLMKLINNILEFSAVESGQVDLENTEFSLGAVIPQITTLLSMQASAKKINLSYAIDPNVPRKIFGDVSRLSQILYALIGNAIKFTAVGSVVLKVKVHSLNPEVALRLHFAVEDTGIGLSKEEMHKLFLPFNAIQSPERGHGLGLVISQQLARAMGGEIQVSSVQGQGSCFSFIANFYKFSEERFGNEEHQRWQMTEEHQEIHPIFTKDNEPTVLVVDDNPTNLLVAQAMLERLGAKTITASNGKEAIYEFLNKKIDLILIDCQMPVMDGFETTKDLRKNGARIPIIAMTARASTEDQQKCFDSGMNSFISKPVAIKLLSEELLKALAPVDSSVSDESLKKLEVSLGPAGMANALRRKWYVVPDSKSNDNANRFH
jgi:signal transduction histidine kinase/CheY-like chemotaxis protein